MHVVSRLVVTGIDPDEEKSLPRLAMMPPAGALLFKENIRSGGELRDLTRTIHNLPGRPFVAIDHEGGSVNRLIGLTGPLPAPGEFRSWPLERIESLGFEWGCMLRDYGFDVDFAPVVDVGLPGSSSGLENRTFGESSRQVIERADAFILGMTRAGMLCCLKHFPGLGATTVDSHEALPVMPPDRPMEEHLAPFKILYHGVPMIMVAHLSCPGLDSTGTPASLSAPILKVPGQWGFSGILISDDLEMGALEKYGTLPERAACAVSAGCHLVIVSHRGEEMGEIVQKLDTLPGEIRVDRINRVNETLERFAL